MNFKERGVTVGDLLIGFIILIISFAIFSNYNKNEKNNELTNNYSQIQSNIVI